MSKVFTVLAREVRHTVMTKAFLIAVVGVPILIVVVMVAAGVMMSTQKEPPLEGTIAVVDADGTIAEAVSEAFARMAERGSESELMTAAREAMASGDPTAMRNAAAEAALSGAGGASAMLGRGEVRVAVERVEGDPHDEVSEDLRTAVGAGRYLAVAVVPPGLLEVPKGLRGGDAGGATPPADAAPDADADADSDADSDPDSSDKEPEASWRLFASETLDSDHVGEIESTIGRAIVDLRITRAGLDPKDVRLLQRRPRLDTDRVGEDGTARREDRVLREVKSKIIPMFFMMLLWISTFSSGTQLLHSTIEEKSNRVMEVLLSACSPFQLLAGKILGQGLVGLIIVAVYSSLGIAALAFFAQQGLISPRQLIAFGLFFFMAYFMVAALMAAVGSAVSDLRDANSLLTPVMLVLMIPLMLWMPITQNPNGSVAMVMSFVPPAIPFVMILRVASDESVPLWQLGLSVVWGYGCTLAMVWGASRIFRVGVLMTGKPPSPLELIRWIRYA